MVCTDVFVVVCGALVPLSGGRIELTALTVQGKTRRAGFHIPAPPPPPTPQQYFCSLKTNSSLLLVTELLWVLELAVARVLLAGWTCTDPSPNRGKLH